MRSDALTAASLLATLRSRGWRLAVAESCTGGELLGWLTTPAGASEIVWGGAVVYSPEAKTDLAGVDAALVGREGAVSEPVTAALAEGIRRRAGVEMGLAITGWAGPGSEGPERAGTVYLGVATDHGTRVVQQWFDGDRAAVRSGAVAAIGSLARATLTEES